MMILCWMGKIRSLLSKGKKLEAVKIYRAEYGTSLGEAQNAVERIAATLPRQLSTARPPESAIGSDPFAEEDTGRRRIVVLAIALLIVLWEGSSGACCQLYDRAKVDFVCR